MPDLTQLATSALVARNPAVVLLVFLVGVISSAGPCAAPRVLAFGALTMRAAHPIRTALTFMSGTLGTYAFLGAVGGAIESLIGISTWIYATVAAVGIVGGLWMLADAKWCDHAAAEKAPANDALGVAFLTGAGFALMVSPCCTPTIGLVLAYSGTTGPLVAAALLVAFGLGHLTPVFGVLLWGRGWVARLATSRWSQFASTVGGILMIVVGAYYAALV